MININMQSNEGIIIVKPTGPLEHADFEKLAKEIDSFPEDENRLIGLLIHTKSFPGWDDFNAFLNHMKFVKEIHKKILSVAIVTDSKIGSIGPSIANLFVSAQIKHFKYDRINEAKQWIQSAV